MSEVHHRYQTRAEREAAIQAALQGMTELWDAQSGDVPAWAAHELTFSQVRLLFLLGRHGPSPVSHVAEWLGVGMPTASGAVDRLERHGLVARQHRQDDRRVVECVLTEGGRGLLDQIGGTRLHIIRTFLEVLTEDELAEMARLITIVAERTRTQPTIRESQGMPTGSEQGSNQ